MQAETLSRPPRYRHAQAAPYLVPPGRWEDHLASQLVADFLGSPLRDHARKPGPERVHWPRVERPYSSHPVRGPIQLDARRWGDGPPPL